MMMTPGALNFLPESTEVKTAREMGWQRSAFHQNREIDASEVRWWKFSDVQLRDLMPLLLSNKIRDFLELVEATKAAGRM
jgi:hypothetical protein